MKLTPIRKKIRAVIDGVLTVSDQEEFLNNLDIEGEMIWFLEVILGRFDGSSAFKTLQESDTTISCIGFVENFEGDLFPYWQKVILDKDSLKYIIYIGREDSAWINFSDSKKWKILYLVSSEEELSEWDWKEHYSGTMPNKRL